MPDANQIIKAHYGDILRDSYPLRQKNLISHKGCAIVTTYQNIKIWFARFEVVIE